MIGKPRRCPSQCFPRFRHLPPLLKTRVITFFEWIMSIQHFREVRRARSIDDDACQEEFMYCSNIHHPRIKYPESCWRRDQTISAAEYSDLHDERSICPVAIPRTIDKSGSCLINWWPMEKNMFRSHPLLSRRFTRRRWCLYMSNSSSTISPIRCSGRPGTIIGFEPFLSLLSRQTSLNLFSLGHKIRPFLMKITIES